MCKQCCIDFYVDRGDVVHESGVHLLNYKGCGKCGKRCMLVSKRKVVDKSEEDDEEEIEITFDHHCPKCDHKVCRHFYSYKLEDGLHKYLMECPLCGRGTHEQYAGVKVAHQLCRNVKHKPQQPHVDEEKEAQGFVDKKQILLNLSGMKQLNSEIDDSKSAADVEDDEWDDID